MKKNLELIENFEVPRCTKSCYQNAVSCPNTDCRHWIDYENDLNCTFAAVQNHDKMPLQDVSERMGNISNVRILQIQQKAIKKMYKEFADLIK